MRPSDSFLMSDLLAGYRTHRFSPTEVIDSAVERANQAVERHVWITRLPRERLLDYARRWPHWCRARG
jgi:hypothetical protein